MKNELVQDVRFLHFGRSTTTPYPVATGLLETKSKDRSLLQSNSIMISCMPVFVKERL